MGTRWGAPRIHGSAKRQVEAMFQEKRAHLHSLQLRSFAYSTQCEPTIGDDACLPLDNSSYAARLAVIGSRVLMRLFARHVEIHDCHTHTLLRTHPRVVRPGSMLC